MSYFIFVSSKFHGDWVEVANYPNVTAPLVGSGYGPDLRCVRASYDLPTDPMEQLVVTNTGLDEHGTEMTIHGRLTATTIDLEGVDLEVEPFLVLDTDYTSFASVYTCHHYVSIGVVRRQFGWILTREGVELDQETRTRALAAFSQQELSSSRLQWTDNTGC